MGPNACAGEERDHPSRSQIRSCHYFGFRSWIVLIHKLKEGLATAGGNTYRWLISNRHCAEIDRFPDAHVVSELFTRFRDSKTHGKANFIRTLNKFLSTFLGCSFHWISRCWCRSYAHSNLHEKVRGHNREHSATKPTPLHVYITNITCGQRRGAYSW